MLYANVMDATGETKLLLFDSICSEIIGQSAQSVLGGSVDEIIDPENLPDPVKSLIGKTYLFLVNVEKANIFDGKDYYKVSKVLLKDGLLDEQLLEHSSDTLNATSNVSCDQGPLMLECSPNTNSTTPSSKRIYPANGETSDQNSTSKKLCIEPIDLEKSNPEFGVERVQEKAQRTINNDGVGKQKGVYQGGVVTNSMDERKEKTVGVKIKVEKKE
ncbi:PREDICTED: uncharacterized protein LOC104787304 [Camelina sativa]|uniref:Uncharacterized protein LOC104787304 n=1 Tax=Camelina sativa TaxID=90675 RepID=A0ABM0Z6K5_CAMSA|nr:PREDICTED: uncharacterized protein LOC104787304 [Camelina sativa]XP_019101536.1 PREDICTED: uncharacterized protein LOC104787304 [Camelina sativa]